MIALEHVAFLNPLKLPTYQSKVEALSIWRDASRGLDPAGDKPQWVINLVEGAVEIQLAFHAREKLGGNAEKDNVIYVPLANIAWYRLYDAPPKPKKA